MPAVQFNEILAKKENPVVFKEAKTQEFTGQGGEKVKNLLAVVNYDYGGYKGSPYFKTPEVEMMGLKREEGKNKTHALTLFNKENNDIMNLISTEKWTSIEGFVHKTSFNIIPNEDEFITEKFGKSKKDTLEILDAPNGEVIKTIDGETQFVIKSKSKDDPNFVKIEIKGKVGSIEQYLRYVAERIFENKGRCGYATAKTVDDIVRKMKHPVYFPVNRETGEYIRDKNPTMFAQMFQYQKWVDGKVVENKFASFRTADCTEDLSYDILSKVQMKGSAVFNCSRFLLRPDTIIPQWKVQEFAIRELNKTEQKSMQQDVLDQYAKNEAQNKLNRDILAKAMEELKLSPPPETTVAPPVTTESETTAKSDNTASELSDLLNSGPVMDEVAGMSDSD